MVGKLNSWLRNVHLLKEKQKRMARNSSLCSPTRCASQHSTAQRGLIGCPHGLRQSSLPRCSLGRKIHLDSVVLRQKLTMENARRSGTVLQMSSLALISILFYYNIWLNHNVRVTNHHQISFHHAPAQLHHLLPLSWQCFLRGEVPQL